MPKAAQSEMITALIAASKSGSDYAFTRLVRLYQSPVRAFLLRLCKGDTAHADDLAQEAFIRVHQKIRGYSGEGKFLSWIYGIAYRYFLDDYRKIQRRQKLLETEEAGAEVTHLVPSVELKLDLERALSDLKLEERSAITLCLSEGLSHAEAAEIMDMPVGSVKSHITRGRLKLKQNLQLWHGESPASTALHVTQSASRKGQS